MIDLLILNGKSDAQAAGAVTRMMLAAGINPPSSGGDARGFMRLLEWRQKLRQGRVSSDASVEYERFNKQITAIPLQDRVDRVINDRMWDRRTSTDAA